MTQNETQNSNEPREATPPALIAWHVSERGEKSFWTRIGAAWGHKDGEGYNIQLDLVPTGIGRIVLRAPSQNEEAEQDERKSA